MEKEMINEAGLSSLKDQVMDFIRKTNGFARILAEQSPAHEELSQLEKNVGAFGANFMEALREHERESRMIWLSLAATDARECAYWLGLLKPNTRPDQGAAAEQ